jgi:tetratricopeptide (TPR) repeat protein
MNLSCLLLVTILAQGLRDEAYGSAVKEALDPMYRLDYEEAIERLASLGERFPEHPGPPLSQAATLWLRELFRRQELDDLDRFISPGYFTSPTPRRMPEDEREAFDKLLAHSESLSRQRLERRPGDRDARYYLGSVEAIRGAFAITVGRDKLAALRHGKKAYQYHKEILDEDPDYEDAYMTVGMYEYVLDNLPWYIKWIAVIAGYTGSEKLGFEYLVRAAEKGRLVDIDARVLLMVLYVREHHYDYGLQLARDLHHLYPENFLFHLNEGQILKKMGKTNDALEVYLSVERKAEERAPNYQKIALGALRYSIGLELLEAGRRDQALERFERAADDPETPARERSLSGLEAGRILDLMGRRDEALGHYRGVLELEDVADAHDEAKRYIRSPYRGAKASRHR